MTDTNPLHAPIAGLTPAQALAMRIAEHPDQKGAVFAGYNGAFYLWDVLKACQHLAAKGTLRRVNPRSSEGDARFVLAAA